MLTKAQRAANEKYIAANYKQVAVRWPADFAEAVKQAAEDSGESLAGYMRRAIEAQMERDKVDRWISVKDRLPETDAWVAVWYRDKDGDCFPTVGQYRDFAGQKYWTTDVDDNERAYPPEEITHWMPLPGPLEADDHN